MNKEILKALEQITEKVKEEQETLLVCYSTDEEADVEFCGKEANISLTIYKILSHGLKKSADKNESSIAKAILFAVCILIEDLDESSFVAIQAINKSLEKVSYEIMESDINLN